MNVLQHVEQGHSCRNCGHHDSNTMENHGITDFIVHYCREQGFLDTITNPDGVCLKWGRDMTVEETYGE